MNETELTLFTAAWGDRHIHYLEKLALPSLLQSGNLPACGYGRVNLRVATTGNTDTISKAIERALGGFSVELGITNYNSPHSATRDGIRDVIGFCLDRKTRLFMVPPDTVLSNGGLFNMREYARCKPVTVAAPHLRVDQDLFLEAFRKLPDPWPMSARYLVGCARAFAHQSFNASSSNQDNGTEDGGISITRLGDNCSTIIHYLPTPYLCWFTESDRNFFRNRDCLGDWDHVWTQHLINEGRLRIFGTSDLFFAVELTPSNTNGVNVKPGSKFEEHSIRGVSSLRCLVGGLYG